jgi:hypothetical protein
MVMLVPRRIFSYLSLAHKGSREQQGFRDLLAPLVLLALRENRALKAPKVPWACKAHRGILVPKAHKEFLALKGFRGLKAPLALKGLKVTMA